MTILEKTWRVTLNILKGCAVLLLLYFFIISIDLLGSSFQLLAGKDEVTFFPNSNYKLFLEFKKINILYYINIIMANLFMKTTIWLYLGNECTEVLQENVFLP